MIVQQSNLDTELKVGSSLRKEWPIITLNLSKRMMSFLSSQEDFGDLPILDFFKAKNFECRLFFDPFLKDSSSPSKRDHVKDIYSQSLNPLHSL